MRLVFMGTPDFAVPFLEALLRSRHRVLAVVTQPDRPRGRGMRVQPPPVKAAAQSAGVPVLQPLRAKDEAFLAKMRELAPDVIVVVAYGQLIPRDLLGLPPRGCINVHPSLLPRHRGASPIQAALLAGDEETGVTTMYMDEGLDTGDIILQRRMAIEPGMTAGDLHEALAALGVPLLLETLERVEDGTAPRVPQDEARATYSPRLNKRDGFLRWEEDAQSLERRVRALTPVPGAYGRFDGRHFKIWKATVSDGAGRGQVAVPGEVVAVDPSGIEVQTGAGRLRLHVVQPENGRRMPAYDFANGYRIKIGERFPSGPPQ